MWCPKCKNEYREGITVCADCKIPLVEVLDESKENTELLHAFADESEAKKLVSYLEYSDISAHEEWLEEEQLFAVFVDKKDYKKARKAFAAFFTVETAANYEKLFDQTMGHEAKERSNAKTSDITATEGKAALVGVSNANASSVGTSDVKASSAKVSSANASSVKASGANAASVNNSGISTANTFAEYESSDALDNMPYDGEDTENAKSSEDEEMMEEIRSAVSFAKEGSYVSKAEKSADYRSSAVTFTLFGVVGIIVMGLHWAGVFSYFSTLSSVIITVLFVGFFIVGIDSFYRAKKAKAESVEEERFIGELKEWLEKNLTYEMLAAADSADQSKEENFLNEMNEMKQIIKKQFGELDPAFLEQFTEEYYNEHFENGL